MQTAVTAEASAAAPGMDDKRNLLAFLADSSLFGITFYFLPLTTVLTSLAAQLTTDKAIIGLVPLGWQASFLLPQLIAARIIRGKRLLRPYFTAPAILSRVPIPLFGLWLYFTRAENPTLTVWLLVLTVCVIMLFDSFTVAPWFEMMARSITPAAKGRIVTISGIVSSVGGIGAGLIVSAIFASGEIVFPINYAYLFFIATITASLSCIAVLSLRERPLEAASAAPEQSRPFLAHMIERLRSDAAFRKVLMVRVLLTVESMSAAFYVVFAREQLKLPEASIGVFTTATVIGGMLGTTLFGWVFNRAGARRVINAASTLQCTSPLIALLVSLFARPETPSAQLGYAALFIVMTIFGAIGRSNMLGYMSYAQAIAQPDDRPAYIGALNTLAGIAALMPVVGGLIIDQLLAGGWGISAYSVIFAITVAVCGVGVLLGYRLPFPQRHI